MIWDTILEWVGRSGRRFESFRSYFPDPREFVH